MSTLSAPLRRETIPEPARVARSPRAASARFGAELARALLRAGDADAVLRIVARVGCEALDLARCAAYLRDGDEPGLAGRASHPPDIEDAVRGLRIGDGDEPIRRALAADGPLVLRDEPLALGGLPTWRATTALAVPLVHEQQAIGLLLFDNAGQPHPFGDAHRELAGALAETATAAIVRLREDERVAGQARQLVRQNRVLRHTGSVDRRLDEILLDGGGMDALVEAIADLTGKPVVVYDAQRHRVAAAGEGHARVRLLEQARDHADLDARLERTTFGSSASVPAMLSVGIRHRHLLVPVDVHDHRWGWIVLAEHGSRLSVLDDWTLRRAATHLALELTVQQRTAVASGDARSTLARLLIRGSHGTTEVARSAALLGIPLTAPRIVAFVTDAAGDGASIDADRLVELLREQGTDDVLVTRGPEGLALMITVAADGPALVAVSRTKRALSAACDALGAPGLVAGLSTVCREPTAMPRAYREARETGRCIVGVGAGGRQRILAADDLGPARLFVANADAGAIERFVEDVLGPLLAVIDRDETIPELLRTLHVYFETGRNVRQSAVLLGIHENTVRYRFARVLQFTGLDVAADPHDQLSAQTAVLVLRLQGHPALPPLGPVDGDEPAAARTEDER